MVGFLGGGFVVSFGFFVHLADGFEDLEHGCGFCSLCSWFWVRFFLVFEVWFWYEGIRDPFEFDGARVSLEFF